MEQAITHNVEADVFFSFLHQVHHSLSLANKTKGGRIQLHVPRNDKKKFVAAQMPGIVKSMKVFFQSESELATMANVSEAFDHIGALPIRWVNESRENYDRYFKMEFAPVISHMITEAGETQWRRILQAIRKDIPCAFEEKKVQFNLATQRIVDHVQKEVGNLVVEISENQREAIRKAIVRYIQKGWGQQKAALEIQQKIGLTSREWEFVDNFFERSIESGMEEAEANRLSQNYSRYLKGIRAERIARTESARSYNFGQNETIHQAIDGDIISGALKTWSGVLDDRERDSHVAMEGVSVGIDEDFIDPATGYNYGQFPAEVNERCGVIYSLGV